MPSQSLPPVLKNATRHRCRSSALRDIAGTMCRLQVADVVVATFRHREFMVDVHLGQVLWELLATDATLVVLTLEKGRKQTWSCSCRSGPDFRIAALTRLSHRFGCVYPIGHRLHVVKPQQKNSRSSAVSAMSFSTVASVCLTLPGRSWPIHRSAQSPRRNRCAPHAARRLESPSQRRPFTYVFPHRSLSSGFTSTLLSTPIVAATASRIGPTPAAP